MSDLLNYELSLLVAYTDDYERFHQELEALIKDKYPTVELLCYNASLLKERKKAFGVKGGYAAKVDPFAVILDIEGKPLKGFYSEVKECTVDNIARHLDSFLSNLKMKEHDNSSN